MAFSHDIRYGSKRDARKALAGDLPRLAGGADRDVYLSPDRRVCYKVDKPNVWPSEGNTAEAATYAALRSTRPDALRHIAPTTAWKVGDVVVLAQPVVTTVARYLDYDSMTHDEYTELHRTARDVSNELGLMDMHDGNWGIDSDGDVVMFDFSRCKPGGGWAGATTPSHMCGYCGAFSHSNEECPN